MARTPILRHTGICLVVGLVFSTAATAARAQGSEPAAESAQATGTPSASAPVDPESDRHALLRPEGGTEWSVFFGYGFNQPLYDSAAGIDIATAGIRWSHLWEAKGSGFFRGHPGLALELVPVMSFVDAESATWAVGANLLYEHHFAVAGSVLPVWRIGTGILYATRAVPADVTKFNFSLLTDLGIDIATSDSSALFLGYRFHHVSNASTGEYNPGINAHTIVFGLSFYR